MKYKENSYTIEYTTFVNDHQVAIREVVVGEYVKTEEDKCLRIYARNKDRHLHLVRFYPLNRIIKIEVREI